MLSSMGLEAFQVLAGTLHFTRAAKRLGLTQSALSQRIANLEAELGQPLFVRDRAGVRLTEQGVQLLGYCRAREQLEQEVLARLGGAAPDQLRGVLRIGAFSSVTRALVMPALQHLVTEHREVQVELLIREVRQLPGLLRSGEADIIVLDHFLGRAGIEACLLGHEEYVLIEQRHAKRTAVTLYLDHDPEDAITAAYLKHQGQKPGPLRRSYINDIYALLDAVAAGWGRAVVPRHLLAVEPRVKEVKGQRPLRMPVVLHTHVQASRSALHARFLELLLAEGARLLAT